jgi:nucleoside-diphosphate-sugar epimerase
MDLTGKTLAISGIGGFIGLRAAERARERGMRVRGIELSRRAAERARAAGADVVVGDLLDAARAREAVAGADVVLHTAALVKEAGPLEDFRRLNVEGALVVARAAREAGARAFVHLSSVMVYGFSYPDHVAENGPQSGDGNPYCITKIESEQALLPLNDPPAFGVIVIRPGDVYGPGSIPWVVRPLELMKKRRFALPGGGRGVINHVYVDNLIDGIFLSIERQTFGEVFNLSDGQPTTFRHYFDRLAEIGGAPRAPGLPSWLLYGAARVMLYVASARGKAPDFYPDGVRFLTRPHAVSIEKARLKLGYSPRVDLEHGLELTRRWLAGQN